MEHGRHADLGAEMLGVGCDGEQGLGGRPEQEGIDGGFVLIGDAGDGGR
jgi:hypothetical protein